MEHNCPCGPEGAVRLVDGIVPYRGRVEYCRNGRWATMCNSYYYQWDSSNAAVVCRQLGYPTAGNLHNFWIFILLTYVLYIGRENSGGFRAEAPSLIVWART